MQKKFSIFHFQLSIIFGLSVFLFFWKLFPYHLHFKEQFQLFLFTQDYLVETVSRPGGFSNYVSYFFTQFFISSFVGALLMSCFLTGIQLLIYAIIRKFRKSKSSVGLLLSFLPALLYWYFLCDENTQIAGVIALLLALISTLIGISLKSHSARRIYLFASIPILYWLAGGVVLLSVLLLIVYDLYSAKKNQLSIFNFQFLIISIAAIGFTISLPFITKYFLAQYTLERYWWGPDYVFYVNDSPFAISYSWILTFLIVVGVSFLPKAKSVKPKSAIRSFSYSIIQLLILLLCIYFVILKNAYPQNLVKEEIMAYDYHCRMQNWDKVIKMADRKSPTIPMTVACLNLALYKTGQLPDKMFSYYQNGPEGLLPTFRRDFMIPTVGGEPYFYLGFVNTAQRFAFEAMESIPDYQKGVRSIKRLAETNLINGNYEAAAKYLNLLEKTLFYKKWAKDTRTYLYNDAKIEAHPTWGEIRRFQIDEDFMFSDKEKDMMLGIFFQRHPDNRMAYEYLMAYTLLDKDIRNFPIYFQLKKNFTYSEIPKSWQEALVYIWGLQHDVMDDSLPFPVRNTIKQNAIDYARIYTSMESPEPTLRKQFPKTYWYYLHFRDFKQTNAEQMPQY
ncbi:MAG: DUF6057 family protein [Dysgonamonadaceae bacterium]|jgi:hypothetical protein|nr:DUF6057 family protein [Dysgonamonadaceae bacterium]